MIKSLLRQCVIIDVTDDIKRQAIDVRRRHRMLTPDASIAATALSLCIPPLTADSDFAPVRELELLAYKPMV